MPTEPNLGNRLDTALKPKISVPIWVVLAAFGIGQAAAFLLHI